MDTNLLLNIAQQHGCPVYVYDGNTIENQFQRLQDAFKQVKKLKINYAAKALTNISVLKLLKKKGSGLDTVSIQEVLLGLEAGFFSR